MKKLGILQKKGSYPANVIVILNIYLDHLYEAKRYEDVLTKFDEIKSKSSELVRFCLNHTFWMILCVRDFSLAYLLDTRCPISIFQKVLYKLQKITNLIVILATYALESWSYCNRRLLINLKTNFEHWSTLGIYFFPTATQIFRWAHKTGA